MGNWAIAIPFLPILSAVIIFVFAHSARKVAARISVIINDIWELPEQGLPKNQSYLLNLTLMACLLYTSPSPRD